MAAHITGRWGEIVQWDMKPWSRKPHHGDLPMLSPRAGWRANKSISQIPQRLREISHNAPLFNRNVHTCTFLLQSGTLWDIGLVHCGICGVDLLKFPAGSQVCHRLQQAGVTTIFCCCGQDLVQNWSHSQLTLGSLWDFYHDLQIRWPEWLWLFTNQILGFQISSTPQMCLVLSCRFKGKERFSSK